MTNTTTKRRYSSVQLDAKLRAIGGYLIRHNDGDGNYWRVSLARGQFNCRDLREVAQLTAVLQDADAHSRIVFDGSDWFEV